MKYEIFYHFCFLNPISASVALIYQIIHIQSLITSMDSVSSCLQLVFLLYVFSLAFPANIYLSKINHGNNKSMCNICSKLTIKTPEWRHWRRSGIFIVISQNGSHMVLLFPLLTLNKYMLTGLMLHLLYCFQFKLFTFRHI